MAGPSTALKSLRAVLAQPKVMFSLRFPRYSYPFGPNYRINRDPDGYVSRTALLGYGTNHMVLVTKRDGFIPCVSPEALWQEVSSPRHTTPVLRAWSPWLYQKLKDLRRVLRDTDCFGCKPGLLDLDDATLDRVVSGGLKTGEITF